MRPLFALFIPLMVFGSVRAYTLFERSLPAPVVIAISPQQAEGQFTLDLTLTFDAAPDEFDLEPSSAVVQLQGRDIFRSKEPHQAATPIRLKNVEGVVEGINTFFVKVAPAKSDFTSQRAIRLRVLRDGEPVADHTLWSTPGEVVQGTVEVLVPKHRVSEPHKH